MIGLVIFQIDRLMISEATNYGLVHTAMWRKARVRLWWRRLFEHCLNLLKLALGARRE